MFGRVSTTGNTPIFINHEIYEVIKEADLTILLRQNMKTNIIMTLEETDNSLGNNQ